MALLLGMALLWFSVRLTFAVSKNYARVVADMWELHQNKNLLLIDNADALSQYK